MIKNDWIKKKLRKISSADFQRIHVDSPLSSRWGLISLIFLTCLHPGKTVILLDPRQYLIWFNFSYQQCFDEMDKITKQQLPKHVRD